MRHCNVGFQTRQLIPLTFAVVSIEKRPIQRFSPNEALLNPWLVAQCYRDFRGVGFAMDYLFRADLREEPAFSFRRCPDHLRSRPAGQPGKACDLSAKSIAERLRVTKRHHARQSASCLRSFSSSSSRPIKTSWLKRASPLSHSRSQKMLNRLLTPWKTARRGLSSRLRKPFER